MKIGKVRSPRPRRPPVPPRRVGGLLALWSVAYALVVALAGEMTAYGRGIGAQDFLGDVIVHGSLVQGPAPSGDTTGTTDTANLTAALALTGRVVLAKGTYNVNWTPGPTATISGGTVVGAGMGQTILKAAAGATAAVTISALARTTWQGITFDGNSQASDGLDITGAAVASSLHRFVDCQFQNALVGANVLNGAPTNEADQNEFDHCFFTACVTGFRDVSVNGQQTLFTNVRIGTTTTSVELGGNATLLWHSGQANGHTTGLKFSGTNGPSSFVRLVDVGFQGNAAAGTTDIDGSVSWPNHGLYMEGAGPLQAGLSPGTGTCVKMGGTNSQVLYLRGVSVINGNITNTGLNCHLDTDSAVTFSGTATVVCTGAGTLRWRKAIGNVGSGGGSGVYSIFVNSTGQSQRQFDLGYTFGGPLQTTPTGELMENFSRYDVDNNTAAITAGTLYMQLIWLPAMTVTAISFYSGGTALIAGGTPHLWAALFDSSRNLIAQSPDDTAPVWAANAKKTFTLSAPQTIEAGYYYVGLMANVGTPPTLNARNDVGATFSASSVAPVLGGSADAGLTTTAPNPAAAITLVATHHYATVS